MLAFDERYDQDTDGRITLQNNLSTGISKTFGYDNNSQLLKENYSDGQSITYSYDNNANRKTFVNTGVAGVIPRNITYNYESNYATNKLTSMVKDNIRTNFLITGTGEL